VLYSSWSTAARLARAHGADGAAPGVGGSTSPAPLHVALDDLGRPWFGLCDERLRHTSLTGTSMARRDTVRAVGELHSNAFLGSADSLGSGLARPETCPPRRRVSRRSARTRLGAQSRPSVTGMGSATQIEDGDRLDVPCHAGHVRTGPAGCHRASLTRDPRFEKRRCRLRAGVRRSDGRSSPLPLAPLQDCRPHPIGPVKHVHAARFAWSRRRRPRSSDYAAIRLSSCRRLNSP
jgi:hypothetical protein